MKFMVSYDLRKVGQNYGLLIGFLIRRLRATRVLQSQWIVESNMSATQILLALRRYTDSNDGLLVVQIHPDADVAQYNLQGPGGTGSAAPPRPPMRLGLFGS